MDIPEDISAAEMYRELMEQIRGKGRCYLLLDEIQEVKGWERCVNSLLNHQAAHVTGIREKSLFFCHKISKIPHFFVASIRLAGRKREIIIQHCVPENVSFHPASFLQLSDTRYDSGW